MRCLVAFILFSFTLNSSTAEPIVIINKKNTISNLNLDQVADIFLKRKDNFSSGLNAIPINLTDGQFIKNIFYERTARKNPAQLKAYWAKNIFTGKKIPPIEFSSDEDVKKFVSSELGAIGYIDKNNLDSSVKMILIIE